ncbi:hypothetical protein BGZ79_007037 [Entomortierella chlamydospora]|nr:hypothetical protein BGZ79_007037 [Entomortierella chlamydospora]
MVALTQKLAQGLVLSLSLSSSIFLASNGQTTTNSTTSKPTTTQTTAAPTSTIAAPPGFLGVASAANSNYIYYQGGQVNSANTTYTNELWSLDLTKSWPISNPAWTNLTTPRSGNVYGPATKGHSATMSTDGNTLLVTAPNTNGGPFLLEYNIAAGSWSGVNSPTAQATLWSTRTSASFVTDSNSASWLVGGSYSDGTSTNEIDKFEDGVWNPALSLSPATGFSSVLSSFNSGTAELYKNKIYIFGGISSTSGQRSYQSFQAIPYIDISTDKPTNGIQYALGSVPPPRQQHCSVLTDSEKVIIYGGYDATNKVSLSDMWSLDLVTWTWTLLLPQTQTSSRYGHTCNIAGANMVVLGGAAVSAGQTGQTGYVKDVQVYDVMLTRWMTSYAPKQDTTPITSASSTGSGGSGGLGVGPIIGIIIGVLVVVGCGLGLFIYKRRQKRIEIREAELEKEAYLASLRPEGGSHSKVNSPSAAHIGGQSTPGMSHEGFNGMDELLLSNASGSPGHGQGNVQYLMQHLPDGTIAVQPVYFDHQAVSSPNMGGDEGGYISPMASATHGGAAGGGGGAYFAPPPAQTPQVTYPQPSHDPFASPVMPNVPLPPGYNPGNSGVGSPQQMPEQLR